MTVLRPSQAPRWKTTTRHLRERPRAVAVAARTRERGATPKARNARPDDFKKTRRVSMASPFLKFRRSEEQAGHARPVERVSFAGDDLPRFRREPAGEKSARHRVQIRGGVGGVRSQPHRVDLDARDTVAGQVEREVEAREESARRDPG